MGIDTGGTFTDTVLVDEDAGDITAVKTPTTDDLLTGIENGIREACAEAGIGLGDVDVFSHGNTIAVNAILERDGARTALVTTDGFRDILEISEGFRDASLLYAPCGERERPLVPRRYRFEVDERMDVDGEELRPLDEDQVDEVIERLAAADVESVAVCLLHSYQNPDHERALGDRLEEALPSVAVSLSSEVSPEIREYSRTATTAVDAYVKPIVGDYLRELEGELSAMGLDASINVMKSDGGVARPQVATKRPVTQTISGPVAGIKAAQRIGDRVGVENVITFDMGGTSCDTALIQGGVPTETQQREVQGMKINGPFVNLDTVGAGGGSIAWLNDVGALRVGPRSAGANPGPACYGRGGTRPTVTDACLVLGILDPETVVGGELRLDEAAAEAALREHVADPLGLDLADAATAVKRVIDDKMAAAVRATTIEEGYDPRDFALMGFGGAGPMHACDVARALDIDTVVFPNHAGLTSSVGLLVSDIKHDYVRSLVRSATAVDVHEVNEVIDGLYERGRDELATEDVPPARRAFSVLFDVRYEGQSHNLTVPLAGDRLDDERLDGLLDDFERAHREKYDFTDDRDAIELVNVRVTATGELRKPDLSVDQPDRGGESAASGARAVVTETFGRVEATRYDRERLTAGREVETPAIVEADNSTVWLPPDTTARVDDSLNLVVEVGR